MLNSTMVRQTRNSRAMPSGLEHSKAHRLARASALSKHAQLGAYLESTDSAAWLDFGFVASRRVTVAGQSPGSVDEPLRPPKGMGQAVVHVTRPDYSERES
jgi:hypothetical protein